MSKLVPNVLDTARIMRNADFTGKFSSNHDSICLSTPYLCFEVAKRAPKGRFFSDRSMIAFAGGPWFIERFKDQLQGRAHELRDIWAILKIQNIQALDLFSYKTCSFTLELNHGTRSNPIALQLVQKARLFSIVDEILEREISFIA
jgi:hypothetical protein